MLDWRPVGKLAGMGLGLGEARFGTASTKAPFGGSIKGSQQAKRIVTSQALANFILNNFVVLSRLLQ